MALTKVLITVKTYPNLSQKYRELVCTAGFLPDGKWIRIYPVPYRKLPFVEQYKKYDWIELDLVKNTSDFRPESYRPSTIEQEFKVLGHIGSEKNWANRKEIVLNKVYNNLTLLIAEAKDKKVCTSLAVFKPTEIIDFIIENDERAWSRDKIEILKQHNLFEAFNTKKDEVVKKLPYKFSYLFKDNDGKQSKLMIEDWEIGQLYWNCLKRHEGDESKACQDVKAKYLDKFIKNNDLYFFLGTTKVNHFRAKNPFIIIGLFYPKKGAPDMQTSLF